MNALFSKFTKYFGLLIIIFSTGVLILESQNSQNAVQDQYAEVRTFKEFTHNLQAFLHNVIFSLESKFYDFRFKNTVDLDGYNNKIILAQISDKTLNEIGSWPIPREKYAIFLNKLKAFGVKTVGFDIFYPEESLSCSVGEAHPDNLFSDSIRNFQSTGNRFVLAYNMTRDYGLEHQQLFDEVPDSLYNVMLDTHSGDGANLSQYKVDKQTFSIQKILETELDLGYISMNPDPDGIFRHYRLVSNSSDDLYFPSMALQLYTNFTGDKGKLTVHPDTTGTGTYGEFEFENFKVPINNAGETKIRWFGEMRNFGLVNFEDVLNAADDDPKMIQKLKGNIVLLGSTATGAHDLRHSPINPTMPGVYAHINMLHMLMNNFFYKSADASWNISVIMWASGLFLILLLQFFGSATIDFLVFISSVGVTYYLDYDRYLPEGYQLQLFLCYASFGMTYMWITLINFAQANREKKQIKGTFARYVAPSIVNDMLDHPEKLKVGGEKRDITCLFSDVRDFTSISEQLSATALARALNIYMGAMTDIVFETMGTLDKYIGDAIVAFWGAPLDVENHPQKAVDAAILMMDKLPEINEGFKKENLPEFKVGLGLNSGECSVGNMGSDQIFSYTALGDNMNLGARLESLCKHYGGQILISEYTWDRLDQNKIIARQIDNTRVKGKTEPVGVYEVLYQTHRMMQNRAPFDHFNQGYQNYLDKNFVEAKKLFQEVLKTFGDDKPALRMLDNCEKYIINPPQEGEDHTITTMTTK